MATNDAERFRPALLEAFERELSSELARRLLEFATRRAEMLRAAGMTVAADEAQFLVRDAISDTLSLRGTWRAGAVPLGKHLRDIIRRRTWALLAKKRRRWRTPVVGEVVGEAAGGGAAEAPSAVALRVEDGWSAVDRVRRLLASLGDRSAEDAAVRLMLLAYCAGAVTKLEVMEHAGFSAEDYAQARRRLDHLLAAQSEPPGDAPALGLWRSR